MVVKRGYVDTLTLLVKVLPIDIQQVLWKEFDIFLFFFIFIIVSFIYD